jgi:hypothetical protein
MGFQLSLTVNNFQNEISHTLNIVKFHVH